MRGSKMAYSEQNILPKPRRRTFSQIGLACFAILAIGSLLQVAAQYLVASVAPAWIAQPWYLWALTFIPLYVIAVPIGFLLFKRIPTDKAETKKLRFKDLLIFLIMCYPVMYIGNFIGTLISTALHTLLGTENRNTLDLFTNGSSIWLAVLFMVLLAPVIEEFIFRKLIIDRVRPYGEGACVLVSALLFGLFHGNLNQFFYAFGLGAIFAFIYVKTGRLRYTIFLHMVINLWGGIIAPLLLKGIDQNALADRTNPQAMMRYFVEHLPQLMGFSLYAMVNLSLVIAGFVLLIVRRRAFFFEHGPLQPAIGTGFKVIFLNLGMALFVAGAFALFVISLL